MQRIDKGYFITDEDAEKEARSGQAEKIKIVWNEVSKQFFKEAIINVRRSSPQNADIVKSGILKAVKNLPILRKARQINQEKILFILS